MTQFIALIIGILIGRLTVSMGRNKKSHKSISHSPIVSFIFDDIKEFNNEDIGVIIKLLGITEAINFRIITNKDAADKIIKEGSESINFTYSYNSKDIYFVNMPSPTNDDYSIIYIFADKLYKNYGFNQYQYKSKIIKSIISSYYIYTKYNNCITSIDDVINLEVNNHTNKIFEQINNTDKIKNIMKFTGTTPHSTIFDSRQ